MFVTLENLIQLQKEMRLNTYEKDNSKFKSDLKRFYTLETTEAECYVLSHFFEKFRQIDVLLKNFTLNRFDGKNLRGSEFFAFSL